MNFKLFINKWGIFLVLCLIWGSSFELIKFALFAHHDKNQPLLTAFQLAALRVSSAGIFMLPFLPKALKNIPKPYIKYAVSSGILGSFLPAFLFCLAQTKIDAGITGCLNALAPFFTIIIGALLFNVKATVGKIIGILIGVAGSVLLVMANQHATANQSSNNSFLVNLLYISLIALATICYATNVNMVAQKLKGVPAMDIAAIAFSSLVIPGLLIFGLVGGFSIPVLQPKYTAAIGAGITLGVIGTATASILFYKLVKQAGSLFASMVTYGIPVIALFWAVLIGEVITTMHYIGLLIILLGVYIANKAK